MFFSRKFFIFSILILLLNASQTQAQPVIKGVVLSEFEKLMQTGCDLKKYSIHTPMEARILRNVPYALLGYKFSSEDLSDLYTQDGDWYKPTTSELVNPKPEFLSCVQKLKAKETEIRKNLKIDSEIEKVLTRDSAFFNALRTQGGDGDATYRSKNAGTKTNTTLDWTFFISGPGSCGGDGSSEQKDDCSGGIVSCARPEGSTNWRDFKCTLNWAG